MQHPHRRRLIAQPGVGTQVLKQSRKSKRSLKGLIEAEPQAKEGEDGDGPALTEAEPEIEEGPEEAFRSRARS